MEAGRGRWEAAWEGGEWKKEGRDDVFWGEAGR